jgi:hypothetical protein
MDARLATPRESAVAMATNNCRFCLIMGRGYWVKTAKTISWLGTKADNVSAVRERLACEIARQFVTTYI